MEICSTFEIVNKKKSEVYPVMMMNEGTQRRRDTSIGSLETFPPNYYRNTSQRTMPSL
jgi:hypothetical protein